jgi:hypothetical protein
MLASNPDSTSSSSLIFIHLDTVIITAMDPSMFLRIPGGEYNASVKKELMKLRNSEYDLPVILFYARRGSLGLYV